MSELENKLSEQLKDHGYKLTPQRRAVLEIVSKHEGEHLNTEEIYELVKKKSPDIGLATVYRALLLFDRLELVYKIDFDDGCSRYEINRHDEDHRHHHLICTGCGSVIEVEEDLLGALEEEIFKKNNFLVKDHRVKFYGYCEKCRDEI